MEQIKISLDLSIPPPWTPMGLPRGFVCPFLVLRMPRPLVSPLLTASEPNPQSDISVHCDRQVNHLGFHYLKRKCTRANPIQLFHTVHIDTYCTHVALGTIIGNLMQYIGRIRAVPPMGMLNKFVLTGTHLREIMGTPIHLIWCSCICCTTGV